MIGPMTDVDDIRARCESEAEKQAVWGLVKYLHDETEIKPQVWLKGESGQNYRPDFLLTRDYWRLAIEIDGAEFHEHERDYARDQDLLAADTRLGIFRIWAKDAVAEDTDRGQLGIEAACFALHKTFPFFFNGYGAYASNVREWRDDIRGDDYCDLIVKSLQHTGQHCFETGEYKTRIITHIYRFLPCGITQS